MNATGSRRGFTIVEVLVVVAILGMLLSVMAFHTYALSHSWAKRNQGRFLPTHADGVAFFLRELLADSAAQSDRQPLKAPEGVEELPKENLTYGLPPHWSGSEREPLLSIYIYQPGPLLRVEENASSEIQAYLWYDENREQLSLIWFGLFQPEVRTIRDLRHTVISEHVKLVEYLYYDDETEEWEVETEPLEEGGTFQPPAFLRLTFAYDGQEAVRYVPLPPDASNPHY